MEVNYDEIVAQDLNPQPKPEKDVYEDLVEQDIDQSATNISSNFVAAESIEPDRAAQVLKLSKDLGLPSDIVERNFDSLSKEQSLVKKEPAKILQTNPALARWLEDPDNVKVAKDDLDELEKIENHANKSGFFGDKTNAFISGAFGVAKGLAKIPANMYVGGLPDKPYMDANGKLKFTTSPTAPPKELYDNKVTQYFEQKQKEFTPERAQKSFIEELSKGNRQAAFDALGLQILSQIPQLGMVAVMGPGSLPVLAGMSSAEKLASNLEAGIPEDQARINAVATGTIEAGIESLGGFGAVGLKQSIKQAVETLGKEGAFDAVVSSIKKIVGDAAGEGNEEVATTVAQSVLDYGMGVDDKALDNIVNKSIDSFVVGMGTGGGVSVGTTSVERSVILFGDKNRASQTKEVFNDIVTASQNSKLKKRSPEKFKEYIDSATKDAGIKDVYIPVEDFKEFFQSKQLNPNEIAEQLGVVKEYNEAVFTGGDVTVPLSSVLDKLGNEAYINELSDNIKFQPDAQTVKQVKKEMKAFQDEIKKTEKQAVEEGLGDATQVIETEIDYAGSSKKIGQIVADQLKGLGDNSKEAKQKSQIAISFFESLGRRTNQDPFELFKKYNLKITGQETAPAQFDPTMLPEMPANVDKSFINDEGALVFDPDNLAVLEARINQSDAGFTAPKVNPETGDVVGTISSQSTFPEFFKDKGYTKKGTLAAIKKYREGGKLTLNQTLMLRDLYDSMMDKINAREYFQGKKTKNVVKVKDGELRGEIKGKGKISGQLLSDDGLDFWFEGGNKTAEEVPYQNIAILESVEINKDARQAGSGSKLVSDFLDQARNNGAEAVFLNASPMGSDQVSLEALVSFYKKNGFKVFDDMKKNVIMFKDLSSNSDVIAKAETAGFDTSKKYYHGSDKKFKVFKPSERGRFGPGIYTFQDTGETSKAQAEGYGKKVYELYLKKGKMFDASEIFTAEDVESLKKELKSLDLPTDFKQMKDLERRISKGMKDYQGKQPYLENALQVKFGADYAGADSDTKVNEFLKKNGYVAISGNLNDDPVMVVLDPSFVKSVDAEFNESFSGNIYSQSGQNFQDMRGSIQFGSANVTIKMLQNADRSTFFHEMGHFYLEVLADQATRPEAPQNLKDDWQTILNYLGVNSREEIQTAQHEKWAESFEKYLQEGNAPTAALKKAFAAFKAWITEAYRGLVKSDVELSKDIRLVMDRMLAADYFISQAEAEMKYESPFFETKPDGMTDEKWLKYQEAFAEARQAGENFVRKKLFEDVSKRKDQYYLDKKADIEQEVRLDLAESRPYKALFILQKGEMPDGTPVPEGLEGLKIARSTLKEFNQDNVKALPRGITAKDEDGVHIEIVAEMLGYGSGFEMIESLSNLKTFEKAVEQETEKRMLEIYPDYLNDPVISQDAIEAVHNQRRADVIRAELEYISENYAAQFNDVIKRLARKLPSSKQTKEEAVKIIASKKLSEIKPNYYKQAEIKARREAGEALAKLDVNLMFEAKRKELLNFELYRVAVEAKENIDKALDSYKKILRKSEEDLAKTRDVDFVNAGRAILAEFGITTAEKKAADYLSKIQAYDPDTYSTLMALVENTTAFKKYYNDLSFDEFTEMDNAVQALFDMSKSEKQFEVEGKSVLKDVVQGELEARLKELSGDGQKSKYWGSRTTLEEFKLYALSLKASLTRVEHWADALNSSAKEFTRYIWKPISDARSKYTLAKEDILKKYRDTAKILDKASLFKGVIKTPELGPETEFESKFILLGAMLHTGNESNMRKLLLGRGWAEQNEDGSLNTSKWDSFVARMQIEGILTKKDYDWMQSIWDLTESLKPEAQKAHKKMYGFYFNEITANPIQTPYGGYRGGYVPAVVDTTESEVGAIRAEKELIENGQNSYMFPTTGRGFTKGRVENYTDKLNLDPRFIGQHLDKVLRFVHLEPYVKQAARIVNDRGFRETLRQYDPVAGSEMLIPWLQRAASQKTSNPTGTGRAWRMADSLFTTIRTRTGMQIMAANTINVAQNYTGIIVAASKVKPRFIRDAVWNYVTSSKEMGDMVAEKSKFMGPRLRDQIGELQYEINDIYSEDSGLKTVREWTGKNAYFLQKMSQNQNNIIIWSAAYNEATENGLLEAQAIEAGDAAVRLTQGAMEATDASRFEAGTPLTNMFTQFYSYFNNIANLQGAELQKIVREMGFRRGAGKIFYLGLVTLYLPAVTAEVLRRTLSGVGADEDDDDQYMDDFMSVFFGAPANYFFAEIPFAGQVTRTVFNQFNEKHYDDKLNVSPAISTIEAMIRTPKNAYDAIDKQNLENKYIRDSLTLIGALTGTPAGALSRPLTYLNNVADGKADPDGIYDFTRGLVTGKSGQ